MEILKERTHTDKLKDNIKIKYREIDLENVEWIHASQDTGL
jgi:hypothetical protein